MMRHYTAPRFTCLRLSPRSAKFCKAFNQFPAPFFDVHPGYALLRPVLLPLFVPRSVANAICCLTRRSVESLVRVCQDYFAREPDAFLAKLGYQQQDRAWLKTMGDANSLNVATSFVRADFVLNRNELCLVELNVGPTLGGIGILDRYSEIFTSINRELLPARFCAEIELPRPTVVLARCLNALMLRTGSRKLRRIALVVADDEVAVPHPYEVAHYLSYEEIYAEIVRPHEIRFEGGQAMTNTGPVDLVYGCFTFDQFKCPPYREFAQRAIACQNAGGPLYIAPPIFTVFGNKGMLQQISGLQNEMASVTQTLFPHLMKRSQLNRSKQRLVLKPSVGYGGKGVLIGRSCDQIQWDHTIDAAESDPSSYVIQEYIDPVEIKFPTPQGRLAYHVGVGCLLFGGEFAGILLRHVPAHLGGVINCKQGATLAAGLVLEDESFIRYEQT